MPNLGQLALRYLIWFIGLRIIYTVAVQVTGLPNLPATGVILAALPAVDVARVAIRDASSQLTLPAWSKIWALCVAIFAAIQIILPAIIFAQMRAAMALPEVLQTTMIVLAATAGMIALFLWIGSRVGR